ncbi:AAA family ATPase [Patescibacteria group bacterium]|nr:AAA family ATPase [Patescibacteria group bacterium]MBU4600488.1 AAA family ATPase [Patescibacteria group bacterium]MCG2697847.1 AAA family ATPase [Candidatus Parcubacteria bacterium]
MLNQTLHDQQKQDREKFSRLIIQSTARNKIIIAGPGTGKSFTFKKFLETKSGESLAITFIKNLAYDLQKDLYGLAESHTFHGYCKKLLHHISVDGIDTSFNYFPKLPLLIDSDSAFIGVNLEKFEEAFHTLTEDERVIFYLERGNYYNAVSHSDAVYRVLKYFQADLDSLPTFCQIVVDEYQDFNPLEVAFIDELAKTSPILIVGDDDQALYEKLKKASPKQIRLKAKDQNFKKFELPYCSRCTQAVVDAVHDVINKAKSLNKLQDRVDKKYFCFLPDKEVDSIKFPKIIYANCSTHTRKAPYISKFIEKEISTIPQEDIDNARKNGFPCVLIAGPSYYTKQIYGHLKTRFTNINYPEEKNKEVDIFDGYRFLMKDKESNLGWRIIIECSDIKQKAKIIKEAHKNAEKLCVKIESDFKTFNLAIVAILEKIKVGKQTTETETSDVINSCGCTLKEIQKMLGVKDGEELESEEANEDTTVSIKITTINGSKGLSANYVFLVGMNNTCLNGAKLAGFPYDQNNPTDNEICQFIVGMTRTRKKCYLISNSRFGIVYNIRKSIFIDWINSSRIDSIIVNADYFKRISIQS